MIVTTTDPDFKKYLGTYTPGEILEMPNIPPEDFENFLQTRDELKRESKKFV